MFRTLLSSLFLTIGVATAVADEKKTVLPDDLAAVPADALGFAHIRVADIWKSDALKELRGLVQQAGDKALGGFDKRFAPHPSTIERLTVFMIPSDRELKNTPHFVAILKVSRPFDQNDVLKSAMPDGVEKRTTNGSLYTDAKSGMGLMLLSDQLIAFGEIAAMTAYVERGPVSRGPLQEALAAAAGKHQIVIAANIGAIPREELKIAPPLALPLLRMETALLTFDLAENSVFDLQMCFANEKAAEAALVCLQDLAKRGRSELDKQRGVLLQTALGDGNTAPLEKLPESAMALVALGGMAQIDRFLAEPPLERQGDVVRISLQIPNLNYTVMAPIGIGLLLPAVQKVRSAASQAQSSNNLKQMGLAFHVYNDAMRTLPPAAICDKNGKPLLSWRVAILPYIEQQDLYLRFKLDEPWDSEHNKKLVPLMPKIYLDPAAPPAPQPGMTHYQVIWGTGTAIGQAKSLTIPAITDGTSNTGMIFELNDPIIWTRPADPEYQKNQPLPRFAAYNANGFYCGLADGSVRRIPLSTPERTLRLLIEANDGMTFELPTK